MRETVRSVRVLWLVLILGMASSGCVYYNTFFNARQSFDEAEKYRKQSGQGTQVGYQTAITKSLKVIENHPNSKYYDDALFVLGVSYYYTEQYTKSDRRLRELITDFPKSKFVREGTLYLAKAKLKLGETEDANALFEEIVQGKFDKETRAEAAMALGAYHSEQKDQTNALRYYMAVRDSLGTEQQKMQAQRFIADGYFEEFKFGEALKGYLQVLGLKPDRPQKYHALYQAAVCSYRMQRIGVGLDYLTQLSKDPLFFDSLGAITLAVGEGHEAAGDMELAENVYQDVAMTSKNNAWVGEAYYRLGLIYQFDYDNVDEAKKFYDKATQSTGGSVSGLDAKSRSTDISRLQALTKAGLDTAAVRMAQEGLDSLPPEDSIDVILEMKLPSPKDTTKGSDTTQTKPHKAAVDTLAAAKQSGPDSLKTKGADSTKVIDTTQVKSPGSPDSMAVKGQISADSQKVNLPDTARMSGAVKARDSAGVVRKDSASVIGGGAKAPVTKDSVKVSDTALVKLPLKVTDTRSPGQVAASDTANPAAAGADTSKVKTAPQTAVQTSKADTAGSASSAKPTPPPDSSALKVPDSTAGGRPDTSLSKSSAPQSAASKTDSITAGAIPVIDAGASPDSAAARRQRYLKARDSLAAIAAHDSLMVKDSTKSRTDTLLTRDSTAAAAKDSLASGRSPDSTSNNTAGKSPLTAKPKPNPDSGLTRAQIFKRINDAAESQYALAELYWFQLDKPDSAMKELSSMLATFPKSDKAPEALIALSQMYRDYRADTATSDSLLHSVLTKYPRSDYVPVAVEALGLKGTAADTGYADYYLRRAESFLFDQKNPDSARYYYRFVARQFPRSQLRDQAAFGAVWVVENYKSPGDSSIYYAYKGLSTALSGSPYSAEASKRLTYTPPPPVKRPTKEKEDKGPLTRADSIMAQGKNMVGQTATLVDTAATYVDPLKAVYVGPKKEDLIILELLPTQTAIEFIYPTQANDLEGNQFQLYFQILLDATGKVIDLKLKVPTSSDDLNARALQTVSSMTFDPLDVSKELQRKAINLILPEDQTDPRGRWYVFKYIVSKPVYLNR